MGQGGTVVKVRSAGLMWEGAGAAPGGQVFGGREVQSHPAFFQAEGGPGLDVLKMGDADGEGVGGVVGRGFGEAEEGADHEGDLGFVSGTAADDGLFDASGWVFADGEAGFGWGDDGGGAGGTEGDGGAEVLHVDGAFDRAAVRLVFADDRADGIGDGREALGLEEGGFVADDAPGDGAV